MRDPMTKLEELLKEKNSKLYVIFSNNITKLEAYLKASTLPYHTDHGLEHSKSLITIYDKLIPDPTKKEMDEVELFLLLSSAYFHDIGMGLKLSEKDSQKDDQTKKQYDKRLSFIRRTHSERVFRFLLHEESRKKFDLDKGIASALAKICKAHSDNKYEAQDYEYNKYEYDKKDENKKNDNWYDDTFKKEVPDEYGKGGIELTFANLLKTKPQKAVNTHRVRIHFLAALLRFSDELDVNYKRTHENIEEVRGISKSSEFEHLKNQLVSGIDIDSEKFEIIVDIFEEELYKGEGDQTAENNKALTEVIVKLRDQFLEVKETFNDNGLMYPQVKFRDPVIDRLHQTLKDHFGVESDSQRIYDDREYGGALLYRLLYEIEILDLSPEYIISNDIDFLFSDINFLFYEPDNKPVNFLDKFDKILLKYKPDRSIAEIDTKPIKRDILEYLQQIYDSSLSDTDIAGDDKFSTKYRKIIREIPLQLFETNVEMIRRKLNQFLKKVELKIDKKNFYIQGIEKEILASIIKDKYSYLRRENFKEKSKNHFIYIVFSQTYFSNILLEMLLEKISDEERRKFLEDRLEKMNEFIRENKNIRFYYHANNLEEESKLLSSELALENSITKDSIIIINDISVSLEYYRRNVAFLENMDTWKIKSIDFKKLKFKFDIEDEFYKANKEYKEAFINNAESSIKTLFSKIRGNWNEK